MLTYYELRWQQMCIYSYAERKGQRRDVKRRDNCPEPPAMEAHLHVAATTKTNDQCDLRIPRLRYGRHKEKDDDLQ